MVSTGPYELPWASRYYLGHPWCGCVSPTPSTSHRPHHSLPLSHQPNPPSFRHPSFPSLHPIHSIQLTLTPMPPRRHRSSTLSSTPSQPEPPTPRPRLRPRRRNSALDRSLALRNLNIGVDSSEVSIDPASSPTVTSFSGHSLVRATKVVAESEASEGGFWHNQSPLRLRNGRTEGGVGGSGGGGRGGEEVSRVATAKGSPWTSDDLERLYRTVKITRVRLSMLPLYPPRRKEGR